jgi:hypothetical protein
MRKPYPRQQEQKQMTIVGHSGRARARETTDADGEPKHLIDAYTYARELEEITLTILTDADLRNQMMCCIAMCGVYSCCIAASLVCKPLRTV